jgi:hypothetical protein
MAKITIDKNGEKQTIEMTDKAADKLIEMVGFIKQIQTDEKKGKFAPPSFTKKELTPLKKIYKELYNPSSFTCKIEISHEGLGHEEITGEFKESDDDIIQDHTNTDLAEDNVFESKEHDVFINKKLTQLIVLRTKVKELADVYEVDEELVWEAIRE